MNKTEKLAISLVLRVCEYLLQGATDAAGLRNAIDDLRRELANV
jgi:hypothetical protein